MDVDVPAAPAATVAARAPAPLARDGWAQLVASAASDNALILAVAAAYLAFWAAVAPWLLAADSWMTFDDGREVAQHGIPHHIATTVVGHGAAWIDQQWLASLGFWLLYRAGGSPLALTVELLLLIAPLVLAAAVARRRGAGATAVIPFLVLPFLSFSSFLRAQAVSSILVVVTVTVLAAESRRPSWRAFALLPMLALWANLHGAVVIGAGLVSLLGVTELPSAWRERRRAALVRASTLVLLAPLCLVATPYGLDTLSYYRETIDNPALKAFETEWQAPTLTSLQGFPLFLIAGATVFLVGKRRRDLTAFELGSLAVTLVAALMAARSIAWFAYAAVILVSPLAERARRRPRAAPAPARVTGLVAAVSAVVCLGALGCVAARPSSGLEAVWPTRATAVVSSILDRDPDARVFASYEYADWILFKDRNARGRVAFNGHLELLAQPRMKALVRFLGGWTAQWPEAARGYRVFVLNPRTEQRLIGSLERETRAQVVYENDMVVVLDSGERISAPGRPSR